jgi:multimeric flavodoxin WrbA
MVNVLVINGSPRGREGITHLVQAAFVRGASKAGAAVEEVFLKEKKIRPCMGCFNCWIKTPGQCAIRDDQADVLEKVRQADVLALATPLYVDGMTAQSKVFVDRLLPLAKPEFVLRDGHCRHPARYDHPWKFLVISNCGFHELDNFDGLVTHCRRMCLNLQAEYIGHLLRPHGPILQYRDLLPAEIDRVLRAAERAGEEAVHMGRISQETMDAVAAEIVPKETYFEAVNSFWRQELDKIADHEYTELP